ncbi:hypothetical protein JHK86_004664 [Glycine max]|nr:hypothetical protein JHK86_004664 [Glycine max]
MDHDCPARGTDQEEKSRNRKNEALLGRPLDIDEVFKETNIRKKDNTWVDKRYEQTYKLQEGSSGGTQTINTESRVKLWVDVVGGKSQGLLYRAGDMSSHYRLGVESLTQVKQASFKSSQTIVPAWVAEQVS